jgi:hypothetical protein
VARPPSDERGPVMAGHSRGTLPGAEHTVFGGYGPFVALVALVLAMALLAPTVAPERVVTTRSTVSGDRRTSLTGAVGEGRRSSGGTADGAGDLRSSATGGVAQERRSLESGERGADGAPR